MAAKTNIPQQAMRNYFVFCLILYKTHFELHSCDCGVPTGSQCCEACLHLGTLQTNASIVLIKLPCGRFLWLAGFVLSRAGFLHKNWNPYLGWSKGGHQSLSQLGWHWRLANVTLKVILLTSLQADNHT